MRQQPFASPGEALEHHGVKGMRWGVRKQEETGGSEGAQQPPTSAARPSTPPEKPQRPTDVVPSTVLKPSGGTTSTPHQRAMVEAVIGKPIGAELGGKTQSSVKSGGESSGLTPNQKKALIGLGVVGAAGAGYLAYNYYKNGTFLPGGKPPLEWDVSGLKNGPLSKVDLANGGFSKKYPDQALRDTNFMHADFSKGYASYTWKTMEEAGVKMSPEAADRHRQLIETLDEMRERYPSVKNLKIEVAPMSTVPGMEMMQAQGAFAAVMPLGKGEARIMYNDGPIHLDAATIERAKTFLPGMTKHNYVGYHEMGHILAVANGDMPPLGKLLHESTSLADAEGIGDVRKALSANIKYSAGRNFYHKRTFRKHGFTFKELSKLSGYAATQPQEAMAELAGFYHHPEMRKLLTPDQLARAQEMFDAMGGVT